MCFSLMSLCKICYRGMSSAHYWHSHLDSKVALGRAPRLLMMGVWLSAEEFKLQTLVSCRTEGAATVSA
jgi:hypothetical protein